jgi:hypothetical protein
MDFSLSGRMAHQYEPADPAGCVCGPKESVSTCAARPQPPLSDRCPASYLRSPTK